MAKHRPTHAKSGFGRYTPPRRLHTAHAAPSGDGVRIVRVAGAIIGGGILASAGLIGLIGSPAGASAVITPQTSPPLSSLGTTLIDGFGNSATVAGGGGNLTYPATGAAGAGLDAGNDNNTAFSDAFGPRTTAASVAGDGTSAIDDFNSASATALTAGGTATPVEAGAEAGFGSHAIDSHNTATAWTFSGGVAAVAGVGSDAIDSDNLAWAGSQFGAAVSEAGVNSTGTAIDSGNLSYAYALFGMSASYSGAGTGVRRGNLAVSQDLGGGFALACAGTQIFGPTGCLETINPVALDVADPGDNADPSHNLAAASGTGGGLAAAFATEGSNNEAAALAVGNSQAEAQALGNGNEASATALGGTAPTSAYADAEGTGADADASAQGAGSLAGASASATQTPTSSSVLAASGLGGDAFASNSGGLWTVSLNGATLIG